MYCEKCYLVFDSASCPVCGNKIVRAAKHDDLCFLTVKDFIRIEMIQAVLEKNNIPFLAKKAWVTHLRLMSRSLTERVSLYVPYSRLRDSIQIENELFPNS